jgi:hypothetical protein
MSVLRERNLRLVFAAQAISGLGTALVPVALLLRPQPHYCSPSHEAASAQTSASTDGASMSLWVHGR